MNSGVISRRRRVLNTMLVALAAIIGATLLDRGSFFGVQFSGPIARLDPIVSDFIVYHLFTPPRPTGNVVVATIDDRSIAELGRFPWPRSVEAQLVDALAQSGVKVIAFDVLLSERDPADLENDRIARRLRAAGVKPTSIASLVGQSNDQMLARAIQNARNVILAYAFEQHAGGVVVDRGQSDISASANPPLAYNLVIGKRDVAQDAMHANAYLPPLPPLAGAAHAIAYADIDEDEDSARTVTAMARFEGRYRVPMFLAIARAFRDNPQLTLEFDSAANPHVLLGSEGVPVDEMGRMMVHFRGPAGTIPHYSVADIIAHRIPQTHLAGKAVIVGMTAHGLGDRLATPIANDFPGVELQATAIDNVLRGDFIHRSVHQRGEARWAGWLLGLAIAIAAAFLSATQSLAILLVLALGYVGYVIWRFEFSGALIGVIFPLVALTLSYVLTISYRYATEGRERRRLRAAFEMYLHPEVLASVVDNPAGLKLGGERRHLSVLFADIVGFTQLAEQLEPEPLVALLNTYMSVMTDVILASGGVVDKLMGDGIMAFWGPPLRMENPARAAIDCALAMLAALQRLRAADERFREIRIGIGIASGDAIVGNLGGERHFDYSAVGDTVNLASRLEGLTRHFNVGILVNRAALDEAGARYVTRDIGLVRVKGRDQSVGVAEIVAHRGDGIDPAYYERFAEATALNRDRARIEESLSELLTERPDDKVAALWLQQLQAHRIDASPVVFEFDTK